MQALNYPISKNQTVSVNVALAVIRAQKAIVAPQPQNPHSAKAAAASSAQIEQLIRSALLSIDF